MVYDDYTKVYGPYTRKDGRKIVILRKNSDEQITISYPKYLVERALDRYLSQDEIVDHIDENINNNDLSNLRILPRSVHSASHVPRRIYNSYKCPICGRMYEVTDDRKKTCGSKHCVGKLGHILGFNKGNNFSDHSEDVITYESCRSDVAQYPSVAEQLDNA